MRACTVPGTCLQPKRSPQPQRSRSAAVHTLQAAAQPAAGGEAADGGGGPPARPRRERVNFAVPGQEGLYRAEHVVQRDLDAILATLGALGFENPSGAISRRLEDLPEGGTVNLVMPREPPLATQVRNLQSLADNTTRAGEQELATFLCSLASEEAPGSVPTTLPAAPFASADGQDYAELDAAVVAGDTLYLGEHKRVLGEDGLGDLLTKLVKIRGAVHAGQSPDLAEALQGVTRVKLFLGGEMVRPGLPLQELGRLAARIGVRLVLPSGKGLGLASAPVPDAAL